MRIGRHTVRVLISVGLLCHAGLACPQQPYPNRAIRVVVPFPPGGAVTPIAHIIGPKLRDAWSQPVVVDNRPGGSTIIGADLVAKSPPDGYTLLLTSGTHILTSLLTTTPYDPLADFAAIGATDSVQVLLAVHPSLPARTLREFIALAKARPGELNYASSGLGSPNHLSAAMFEAAVGVRMQHVPYKGGGPAVADLVGGQVQLFFNSPSSLLPYVKAGRLRGLAVSGAQRLPALPNVPTFTEAGLPGFGRKGWHGYLAPAGTPKAVVDKLSIELARILAMPDTRERIGQQGAEVYITTPEEFAALMKADQTAFAQVIKDANIRMAN